PGKQDRHQRERQEEIHLPLHSIVNLSDSLGRLFFAFVVLHEQARDGRTQGGLPCLQRQLNLASGLVRLAVRGQRESSIDGIPELRHGISEILPLFGSSISNRYLLLLTDGIVQV